jgi:hypothetical protein
MRRIFGLVAMAGMLAGIGMATAQFVDPSTGIPVDPITDPVDFANATSGQPTNIGVEAANYAMGQAQAAAAQALAASQTAMQASNNLFPMDDSDSSPSGPVMARTPNPAMTPDGGSFKGNIQVAIADKDRQAMIHYTVDGSKPTQASPMYVSPLTVTAKTKVRAMAAHGGELPSSVVSKTFKAKS